MAQALERLVVVVRETPRAAEVHATLAEQAARAAAALAQPERIDAGVEGSAIPEGTSLRGRLLARAVDWIEIGPAASSTALLQLASALASDDIAMPLLEHVTVTLVPLPLPMRRKCFNGSRRLPSRATSRRFTISSRRTMSICAKGW